MADDLTENTRRKIWMLEYGKRTEDKRRLIFMMPTGAPGHYIDVKGISAYDSFSGAYNYYFDYSRSSSGMKACRSLIELLNRIRTEV